MGLDSPSSSRHPSFIADSYKDRSHGISFGILSLVGAIGGIGGGILTTIMAGQEFLGMSGWRFAFLMMAFVSLIIGLLVYFFVDNPKKTSTMHLGTDVDSNKFYQLGGKVGLPRISLWRDSFVAMKSVIKVQTFHIIVLQGIIGSLPWTAIVFLTMWFQLIGFDHKSLAILNSLFSIGCATSSFMGGFIVDRLSWVYPNLARVMCAQFSAFMDIPFSLILFTMIPQSIDYWFAYAATLPLMGLIISWCTSCANNPMFAVVVPRKHRTMIYAFDRAFEGLFSSLAAPVVGLVTKRIYGYDSKSISLANRSLQGALALSRGLLTMMVISFGVGVLFYSPLYIVFKKNRENAKMASSKEQDLELT